MIKLVALGMVAVLPVSTGTPVRTPAPRRPGPCQVVVPDVLGMPEQAAKDALAARGLTTYVWMNKEASVWLVVFSDPAAGTVVNRCVDPMVEIWIGQ